MRGPPPFSAVPMPVYVFAPTRRARGRILLGTLLVAASFAGGVGAAPPARPRAGPPRAAAIPAMAVAAAATRRVRMIGDDKGYRFEPAQLTIRPGDRVDFVLVSGGPHNVQFDAAAVPAAAKARLAANMPDAAAELIGPLLTTEGQTYTVSFAGVPAGTYKYVCTPHAAMNMAGTITVKR